MQMHFRLQQHQYHMSIVVVFYNKCYIRVYPHKCSVGNTVIGYLNNGMKQANNVCQSGVLCICCSLTAVIAAVATSDVAIV